MRIHVSGVNLELEVDTGVSCYITSDSTYNRPYGLETRFHYCDQQTMVVRMYNGITGYQCDNHCSRSTAKAKQWNLT